MTINASAARRALTRPGNLAGAAVRAAGQVAFWALIGFHAWLLWTHLLGGQAFEPEVAVRWLVAVGVLAGFRALSRRGFPIFFGRRAVVLWLLVILIHCHAVWMGDAGTAELGVPETLGALAQLTASVSVLGTLLVVLLATRFGLGRDTRPAFAAPVLIAGLPSAGISFRFFPRPPPLA